MSCVGRVPEVIHGTRGPPSTVVINQPVIIELCYEIYTHVAVQNIHVHMHKCASHGSVPFKHHSADPSTSPSLYHTNTQIISRRQRLWGRDTQRAELNGDKNTDLQYLYHLLITRRYLIIFSP